MIYLFVGNNHIALKSELQKWKDLFLEKHGSFNLFHIKNTRELEKTQLQEILTSGSFLGAKKLVLMEISPEGKEEEESSWRRDLFIETLIPNIPEETIVVFYSTTLKESHIIYKKVSEGGKVVKFDRQENEEGTIDYLKKRYQNISERNITTIVKSKGGNIEKSIQEIEKFLTYSEQFTTEDILENSIPEIEESMFRFTDSLYSQNFEQIQHLYKAIQQHTNFYYFYNTLLGSLRTVLFIETLKQKNTPSGNIEKILQLGKKGFLIQKRYKLEYNKLENLYLNLVDFDKKIKTGLSIGSQEEELYKELEIIIYRSIFTTKRQEN